jgi:hypothetical protein
MGRNDFLRLQQRLSGSDPN